MSESNLPQKSALLRVGQACFAVGIVFIIIFSFFLPGDVGATQRYIGLVTGIVLTMGGGFFMNRWARAKNTTPR